MLSDDDKRFLLELVYDEDVRAWKGREMSETVIEQDYYDQVIETCERIEKELRK